jgi:Protein of unknown function (DUF4232)
MGLGGTGRVVRVLAAVVTAGVIGAACSSHHGTNTGTGTTAPHHGTTTTTTTAVVPTTATTSTTTGIGPCNQVTATVGQIQGAAGTIVGTITLAEVGSGTCTMLGYPSVTRFNASGAVVPTTVVNGLTVNLSGPPSQPPVLVTLSATQQAEFTFQYSDVTTGTETSCATSTTASVTSPGATAASAPVALMATACNNGTVNVSPVYAATAS